MAAQTWDNKAWDEKFRLGAGELSRICGRGYKRGRNTGYFSKAWGKEVIKHQVDDDARDGDVEPHGKSPARDAKVPRKLAAKSPNECNDDEWNDHRRQYRVRHQNDEV